MASRQVRTRVTALLAAAVALSLLAAAAVLVLVRPRHDEMRAERADRAAVRVAAERFMVTWNTFSPREAEAYVEDVSRLLSTKFRTEFQETSGDVVRSIRQLGLRSTGTVLSGADGTTLVGVADLDADSATVLVVADAERRSAGQTVVRHWRWEVSLVKVGGEWLVDDFEQVGAVTR